MTEGVTAAGNRAAPAQRQNPAGKHIQDYQGIGTKFEEFWNAYPSRGTHTNPKEAARERFVAVLRSGVDPTDIIHGAENYRKSAKINGTDPRYIQQAVTWLRQKGWGDHQLAPDPPKPRAGLI